MSAPSRRLAPRTFPGSAAAALSLSPLAEVAMRRGWFLLLLAVSLGGWAIPTPWPLIRFGALWILFLVIPGLALTGLLFGSARFASIELVAISFCLSLLVLAVPGTLAYLVRLDLDQSAALFLVVVALAVLAGLLTGRRPAGPEVVPGRERGWTALLAVLMGLVSALAYRYAGYAFTDKLTDVWFHLAFVRKIYELGVADPANPFLRGEGVEFVYGFNLWHLLLALFARWMPADPLEVWGYAVPFVAFTFLCALFPLARALFGRRLALTASFLYLLAHAILAAMDSLVFSPKPSSIAIWIFPPVVLAFFVRYVSGEEARFLWVAALVNVVPAALHFIEPMGVLFAMGLLLVGGWLWSENCDQKARMVKGLAAATAVFLVVFALKLPFLSGQSGPLSEYAAQRPIHLWSGLLMNDPFNSELRQPLQIAVLLLMPLLFGWVRDHLAVQLLVFVPMLYFLIQYNPVFATLSGAVTGEVFVRKGISFLRVLNVITLALVVSHYFPLLVRRAGAWWQRGRAGHPGLGIAGAIILAVGALTAAGAYFLYFFPALVRFGHTKLAVPERHALKGFFVGPVGILAFAGIATLLAMELLRPRLGPILREAAGDKPDCSKRTPLFVTATLAILLLLMAAPLLDRRYTRPSGGPFPRDLSSIIPGEYRYLREAVQNPAVVLVKPRDRAFDQNTGAFFLQAFTKHYAVSLPDPDYKKTRSGLDYPRRFRDVKFLYGGKAGADDVLRLSGEYGYQYIVASRRDSSRPLFDLLTSHPDLFPRAWEKDGVGVFKVAER